MLRSVTTKSLFDQRRAVLGWIAGLVALDLIVFLYYPAVRDNPALTSFYKNLPPALQALSGGVGADFASPAGYLSTQLFANMVPLIFIIYGVILGAAAVGREEDSGTAELLLAVPVSRSRIVAEKAASIAVLLTALGVGLFASLLLGKEIVGMEIGITGLLASSVATVLIGTTFAALALAFSCGLGRRAHAGALTGTIAFAGFLLYSLAPLVPSLHGWQKLSAFYWYLASDPVRTGFHLDDLAVLAAATAVLAAVGVWLFDRRDVST